MKSICNKAELKAYIDKFKSIPLSNYDIEDLLDGQVNIVMYPDMHKYKSLDELLYPYKCCIILYETAPRKGHWVCLTLRPDIHMKKNGECQIVLEYWNSYGSSKDDATTGMPDDELKFIPKDFAIESNQDYPYLTRLILDCNYKLTFNEFPFQKLKAGISTCGRWCVLRCLLKELSLEEFRDLFLGLYGDEYISLLTSNNSQLK